LDAITSAGHPAREVSLPACVVFEDVEDRELRVAEPDREPRDRPRLFSDERSSALEEARDVLLLAWLCLERHPEPLGDGGHNLSFPSSD
jgi:hypothetical protein